MSKGCVYLPHGAKALLELFCLQSIVFGWRQSSSSSVFASWGKMKIHDFTLADQDWIGVMNFNSYSDQNWIGFNFIGSGLDSDWKISQSAHLWSEMRIQQTAEMSTDQDWIRTEANFDRIKTGSNCNFLKFGRSGLDRTEKIFVVLMKLFWKYQKFYLWSDFTGLLNGSVYFAIKYKNSPGAILQFELCPFLFSGNVEFYCSTNVNIGE